MTPLAKSQNLAARMGRWSAAHRKTAIFGWLAFVAVAVVLGSMVGSKSLDPADELDGDAEEVLRGRLVQARAADEPREEELRRLVDRAAGEGGERAEESLGEREEEPRRPAHARCG